MGEVNRMATGLIEVELGGVLVRVAPLRWTVAGMRWWEVWKRIPEPGGDGEAVTDEEWLDVMIPALRECLEHAGYAEIEVCEILGRYSPFDAEMNWRLCAAMRGKA